MNNILFIKEYNLHGRLIYGRYPAGDEIWYDSNGNVIHFKYSNGHEEWFEYDQNGNEIHWWNSKGIEYWWDSKGRKITKKEYEKLFGTDP